MSRTPTTKTKRAKTKRAKTKPAKTPAAPPPALIPEATDNWTVTTEIVARMPDKKTHVPVNVRVSRLYFGKRLAVTLEGPTSDHSLRAIAREWNAKGIGFCAHQKSFADLTEASRAKASIKHFQAATGPGFTAPE